MDTIKENKKRISVQIQRLLMMMVAIIVASMTITACLEDENENDDENGNGGAQTGTYTGEKDGTKFTLKITKGANTYASQVGYNYELTASSKKSTGSIIDDESDILTLQPSNASSVFFVTVDKKNLTSIYEPITWSDGSTSRAPGVFPGNYPFIPDYNIRESCQLMYGEIVDNLSMPRLVWDKANSILARTELDYYSFGYSYVKGTYYQWFGEGNNVYQSCPGYSLTIEFISGNPYIPWINYAKGIRVFPDREIAGKTCSVYDNNGTITAFYRCILFLEINRDGNVRYEVLSYRDVVENYMPPPGYTKYADCDN